ncbi:MAG: hypothetical protein ACHQ9S_27510 [Candidatus Binatia bacterium]
MQQNGIDATLVISPGESGSTEEYIPPTYSTRCTSFNSTFGCRTTQTGGGSYSKPWAVFSAQLFDAANGEAVWIATATSKGDAFAHSADLVRSMADKTLERLKADRVVR